MNTVESLEAEAAKLSRADRSRLLEHLVASLDADPDVETEWEAVAEQRQSELESGSVQPLPYEEVVARLEARFPA